MIANRKVLTDDMIARIEALASRYPTKQALTLPALHVVHDELRHVPLDAVVEIAQLLGLAPAEVQDTLTFYQFFTRTSRMGEFGHLFVAQSPVHFEVASRCLTTFVRKLGLSLAKQRPTAILQLNQQSASAPVTLHRACLPEMICIKI